MGKGARASADWGLASPVSVRSREHSVVCTPALTQCANTAVARDGGRALLSAWDKGSRQRDLAEDGMKCTRYSVHASCSAVAAAS